MTMKAKHIPLRRCVVCRTSRPQAELLRFYKVADAWQLDVSGKGGGRGAWLCREAGACHRVKALKRFFRAEAESVAQQVSQVSAQTTASPTPTTQISTIQTPATQNCGGMNVR